MDYFTLKAKKAFNYLQKTFIKPSILKHFDLAYNIRIEIDVSGYVIMKVFSQMTLDQHFSDYMIHKGQNLKLINSTQ